MIAAEALNHAVASGDWPLALRAATALDRRNALLPDARFLLVADAFRSRDWRAAGQQIDALEREQLFGFTVPVLRAGLAFGSGRGDPLAMLPGAEAGEPASAAASYAAEHRPLLLAAMGRGEEARRVLETTGDEIARAQRLRVAVAATLAAEGERREALAVLQGDETPAVAATRRLIEARRPVPGAITRAQAGVGELMIRLSLDMFSQDLAPVAASFARLSTWLAPDNSQTWMLAAELLAWQDREDAAIALLANIRHDDPFTEVARDQKVRLLVEAGAGARALTEAEAAAGASGATVADLVRFGEVLMDQDRPGDAARVFARAIDARAANDGEYPEWALWLSRGSAHDQADEWEGARAALEQAYRLAPEEPLVLNYLGYAQLERRENIDEAERLVRAAHRLAPDNAAITDSLGWALYLQGHHAEAIALLEQAAEGEPADVEINEHLGDAYYAAGRRIEARFAWTAARVYAEDDDATRIDAKIERGLTPQLAAR
ncbi:MAG: tetratricopeptide repeat protein [Allosphingosinicella sp.]